MNHRRTAKPKRQVPHRKPWLTVLAPSGATRGVALVLHGGKSHSFEPVQARHLSPARMVPFARHLHGPAKSTAWRSGSCGTACAAGTAKNMSPLKDARWALAKIRATAPRRARLPAGPFHGRPHRHLRGGRSAGGRRGGARPVARRCHTGRRGHRAEGPDRARRPGPVDQPGGITAVCAASGAGRGGACSTSRSAGAGHFMFRRVRLWHTLATGFLMKAFLERDRRSRGRVLASAAALDRLLPPSGGALPLVL